MTWTALAAEYVIIGSHTVAWLFLLALAYGGVQLSTLATQLAALSDAATAGVALASLVATYSLGILLDTLWFNIAFRLLKSRNRRLWHVHSVPSPKGLIGRAFYRAEDSLTGPEGLSERLTRRRSRLRIFRSLVFNVPFLTLSACLLHFTFLVVACGLLVEALAITAYLSVHDQYVRMVARHARTLSA